MSDPLQPMDYTVPCSPHTPSFTISWYLFKFMSIELVMLSNHLILWRPLLLPSVFPSIQWTGCSHQVAGVLEFQLQHESFQWMIRVGFFYYQFLLLIWFSSVQFSCSVVSGSSRPHAPQHARPPCPSPTPGVHPNPSPLSRWCHLTISSSVIHFSSCPQSLPASESFPVSQLLTSGGQSIGVSASTSVLPMNTRDCSPLGWTSWISLQSKGLSRVFSSTTVQKHP